MSKFNNFAFYKTLSGWSPLEAASLIHGIDPESINRKQLPENISNIMDMVYRSIQTDNLEVLRTEPITPESDYPTEYFSPFVFLEWVKKLGFDIPRDLEYVVEYHEPLDYSLSDYEEGRVKEHDIDPPPTYKWVDSNSTIEYHNPKQEDNMNIHIKKLNSNGYAYYRTLEYWEPLEASAVVCGLDPNTIDFKFIPTNVEQVYKLLERAFNQELLETTVMYISNKYKTDFFYQYSSSFFNETNYGGNLHCLHAIGAIQFLKYKMRIETPSELELIKSNIPF